MGFRDTLKKWDEEDKVKAKPASNDFDMPDPEEIFGAKQEAPAQPKPNTDYRTDTATNAEEAARIAEEKKQDENDVDSFLYGAARGATLGGIDRLVGLGNSIGERAAASGAPVASPPKSYSEARKEYIEGEDKAREMSPGYNLAGNVIGSAVTAPIAPSSMIGRVAAAGATGAISGALNTRQDDAYEMAKNAAISGAANALVQRTAGETARGAIRGAPKRELNRTTSAIVESEYGRVNTKAANALAKDIEDVQDVLVASPEVRKAIQKGPKESRPLIKQKMEEAMVGQPDRYALVDETLPKMSVVQLMNKLVKAEDGVSTQDIALVKPILKKMRDSIKEDLAPRWGGETEWTKKKIEIPTSELRAWVTSAQRAGKLALVGVEPSQAAQAQGVAAKIANDILEERLDAAAAKGGEHVKQAVAQIRESDRLFSAWKNIDSAQEALEKKVLAQNAGLNKRLAQAGSGAADQAALALAATGNVAPAIALTARSRLAESVQNNARFINDKLLVPLQEAAARGAPLAFLTRMAAENGAPQGLARAVFEKHQNRNAQEIEATPLRASPIPTPQSKPVVAPAMPKDYRTTIRTQ